MDIISFFRDIDGVLYYIILVVNAILIFAIIGYLGEKNNEKIVKMGMNTQAPNLNGAINLNVITQTSHSEASIPTLAPTMSNVPTDANNSTFVNNSAPNQEMVQQENNGEVPAVLVINSENTNMPK